MNDECLNDVDPQMLGDRDVFASSNEVFKIEIALSYNDIYPRANR